jgi:type I restriction enzyme S subunit
MKFEQNELERYSIKKGDLLICEGGDVGRSCVWERNDEMYYQNALHRVRFYMNINPYFYMYIMMYYANSDKLQEICKGVTIKHLTRATLLTLLFPLPPQNESVNILNKILEFDSLLQNIEVDKNNILCLISSVKSKILDLAIRGQLVPQDPNDEPASVLLERIRTEKEELIKQGKIKRDKRESIIFKGEDNSYYLNNGQETTDISDDIPFNIPNSWCWARLKDIFIINPRNKVADNLDVSFIPMPLIDDGYSGKHTSEVRQWKEIKTGFTHFAEGDIGVAKITPCFENRKSAIFKNLTNGYGAGTTELHILRPYKDTILAQYVLAYVKSDYFVDNGRRTFSGAVGQQRISREYIENAYFPIPPVEEQYRIVRQISILFRYLDIISDALF